LGGSAWFAKVQKSDWTHRSEFPVRQAVSHGEGVFLWVSEAALTNGLEGTRGGVERKKVSSSVGRSSTGKKRKEKEHKPVTREARSWGDRCVSG